MNTQDCLSFMIPIKIITENVARHIIIKWNTVSSDLHVDDYDCDYVSITILTTLLFNLVVK